MKYFSPLLFCLFFSIAAIAQPANDNCSGAIPLTLTPLGGVCPGVIYTNGTATDATGSNNSPTGSCFNGLKAFKDVWFTFTTGNNGYQNYRFDVKGTNTSDSIVRPQIALYYGNCSVGLFQDYCQTQTSGVISNGIRLDAGNMRPNTTYYVQVASYQATDVGGKFTLCVKPFEPIYNLTLAPQTSSALEGVLYDSGGPLGNYGNNENATASTISNANNYTFNIQPTGAGCIELTIDSLSTEPNTDTLNIYDGRTGVLLDRLSGANNRQMRFQASTSWIKVQFRSDNSVTGRGFKLSWRGLTSCNAPKSTSCAAPEIVPFIPFNRQLVSTCNDALGSVSQTPCKSTLTNSTRFIEGKDHVYKFKSNGGQCVRVVINGIPTATFASLSQQIGANVGIYRGCPDDPSSVCVAQGKQIYGTDSIVIRNASLEVPGDYYVVVGRKEACMPYNILIDTVTCLNVLPNAGFCERALAINDCSNKAPSDIILDLSGGGDSTFMSFLSPTLGTTQSPNTGCIESYGGIPPHYNFVFMYFKAQADGKFGFNIAPIVSDPLTDIDFNVYGPIDNQTDICKFVKNNQPARSSYGQERLTVRNQSTGLAAQYINTLGQVVVPVDVCEYNDGDGYLSLLDVKKDKFYVIWINDYQGNIGTNGVHLSFDGTTNGVLDSVNNPLRNFLVSNDTFLCPGIKTPLVAKGGVAYRWTPVNGLSDTLSATPTANPATTTNYTVKIQGTCRVVPKNVKVTRFAVNDLPSQIVCAGQKLQFTAGDSVPASSGAAWVWTSSSNNLSELSCINCPNPIFTATNTTGVPETHQFTAALICPNCNLTKMVTITVNPGQVAKYEVITSPKITRDTNICIGLSLNLLKPDFDNTATYVWNQGLVDKNPNVTPITGLTKYYVTVTGGTGGCTASSFDSVLVRVFTPPVLAGIADTTLCRDASLVLGNSAVESQTNYQWTVDVGTLALDKPTNPNPTLKVQPNKQRYILTATNAGNCVTKDTVTVTGIDLSLKISVADSTKICRGSSIKLGALSANRDSLVVKWRADKDFTITDSSKSITVSPVRPTKYFANITQSVCTRNDSITIFVDSLPSNRDILPKDTTVCKSSIVILRSLPAYEAVLFPNIKFKWSPPQGFQTPDSLYEMVIQADTTQTYKRLATNGVCSAIDTVRVIVNPIPTVTLSPSDTVVCSSGGSVTFTATISPTTITDIKWKDPQGQEIKSASGQKTLTVTTPGKYTVIANNGKCPNTAYATFSVAGPPSISPPNPAIICPPNGTLVLNNAPPDPNVTYSWTGPNNFTSSSANPVVGYANPGTYTVNLKSTNGCSTNTTVNVVAATATLPPISDVSVCAGTPVTLTANGTTNTTGTYKWNTGETTASISPQTVSSATYTVSYTFGNNCGPLTQTAKVIVLPGFTVSISPDSLRSALLDQGTLVNLNAIVIGTATNPTYTWTVGGNVVGTTSSISTKVLSDSSYKVAVSSTTGCKGEATLNIMVRYPNFEVPNAFTPNGDTINSNFNIVFNAKTPPAPNDAHPRLWKGIISVESMQVFSRWGTPVYQETNIATLNSSTYLGWDGTNNGTNLPPDVYVYLIKLRMPDGTLKSVSGELNLIR